LRNWSGRPSITVPKWRPTSGQIEIHSSTLPADERTVLDGIPITTVPRTLLDLATILDADALLRAVNEAEEMELADPLSLPALLERHRGERGTAALRSVLEGAGYGMGVTNEALEELFAKFIRVHTLPQPELNAPIHVGDRFYIADCLWRSQRLIVELQSVKFHSTAPAMTSDAERTRRLTLAGWRVIPVTWAQLNSRAKARALAHDLRHLLCATPARRPPNRRATQGAER
jgi:very-short-patch-repair endonuclease